MSIETMRGILLKIIRFVICLLSALSIYPSLFALEYNLSRAVIVTPAPFGLPVLAALDVLVESRLDQCRAFLPQLRGLKPRIVFYDTIERFAADWKAHEKIGGVTRGGVIYLQPYDVLVETRSLESVLGHEIAHTAVGSLYPGLPYWVNEGLAGMIAGDADASYYPVHYSSLINWDGVNAPPWIFLRQYQVTALSVIKSITIEKGASGFLSMLGTNQVSDWKLLLQKYYEKNAPRVRVLLNSRGEKRLELKFPAGSTAFFETGGREQQINVSGPMPLESMPDGQLALGDTVCDNIRIECPMFTWNSRNFRGKVRAFYFNGSFTVVNELPLDEYLFGVVASEMPGTNNEALKVQAVLSRSVVFYRMRERRAMPWDVSMLTVDQAYRGLDYETPAGREAVLETAGQVLLYDSLLCYTPFSSTCGGAGINAQAAWGSSLPWCRDYICRVEGIDLCSASPHTAFYTNYISSAQISEIFGPGALDIAGSSTNGLVTVVSAGGRKLSFDDFKARLARTEGWAFVKSPRFRLEKSVNGYNIIGNGLGHGVGLCQYGAAALAMKSGYISALLFYYQGAEVEIIRPGYEIWR